MPQRTAIVVAPDDAPETPPDGPGAPDPENWAHRPATRAAAHYVAIWLRGRSFGLGHPLVNEAPALELLGYLRRQGFDIEDRRGG